MSSLYVRKTAESVVRRLLLVAGLAASGGITTVLAQSEAAPVIDPSVQFGHLQAGTPKADAMFGLTMARGKLRLSSGDFQDDLVVCAPTEDEAGFDQLGAAHIYENAALAPPTFNFRLLPLAPESGLLMGTRSVAIANLRGLDQPFGEPRDNLILISCFLHTGVYPGYGPVDGIGSVEMYDFALGDALGVPQQSLFPPLTVTTDGGPSLPSEVRGFGHGLAVADVNSDSVDDLIVGAMNTAIRDIDREGNPYLHASTGRTYILLGHEDTWGEDDFWDQPYMAWLGIDAPESLDVHDGIAEDWGGGFGEQVVGIDLGGNYGPEVVVSRPDTIRDATPCAPQPPLGPENCPPQGGSVYVFRGIWVHDQFAGNPYDPVLNPTGTFNLVITPPRPDPELVGQPGGLDATWPEYQILRNPFGDVQPNGPDLRSPLWHDWFGWFVFDGGDCGSPQDDPEFAGDFDDVRDLVVHTEDCDYIGTGNFAVPQVGHVGGLVVYHGRGNKGGSVLVDPRPLLLQRPINVQGGVPTQASRIGRSFARADEWFDCLTGQLEPALFIGEIDASWDGQPKAGRVDGIRLPLPPPTSSSWWVPLPIVNMWGSEAMIEPLSSDPTEWGPRHEFGSWIVTLDHKGNPEAFPGQQLVISARQAVVEYNDVLLANAGRAYPYLPVYQLCSSP